MHDLSRRSFLAAAGGLSLASLCRPWSGALAQGKIKPGPEAALLVVDVQNCFLPGGSLAVAKGDEIVPLINRIAKSFQNVVLTQDWHTPGHVSFASSHPGKKPFETIKLPTATRSCGPTTACRAPTARRPQGPRHPARAARHPQGLPPEGRRYSAFIEADGKTQDRARRLSEGSRHRASSWPGSPPTSASPGRRSTREGSASTPSHRGRLPRHRRPAARWPRRGRHGGPASSASSRADLALGV